VGMIEKIAKWGRRRRPSLTLKAAFKRLHFEERRSPAEIGDEFGGEGRAVRFWIDALKVKTDTFTPRIMGRARELGFRTLADYFRARGRVGLSTMVRELGVSRTTVEAYYRAFVDGLRDLET